MLRAARQPERVMVDCSHDNSEKDPARQPLVAAVVAQPSGGRGFHSFPAASVTTLLLTLA